MIHDEEGLPFTTDRATSVDDIATQIEERERESALAKHRARAAAAPPFPTGVCANCQHVWPDDDRHFCDDDCRDDFENRAAARRRNGRG